jgi:hypothetical protein
VTIGDTKFSTLELRDPGVFGGRLPDRGLHANLPTELARLASTHDAGDLANVAGADPLGVSWCGVKTLSAIPKDLSRQGGLVDGVCGSVLRDVTVEVMIAGTRKPRSR